MNSNHHYCCSVLFKNLSDQCGSTQKFNFHFLCWMQCDHVPWSTWIKEMPSSIQTDFGIQMPKCLWWYIKNNVENKHCQKILLPLLINSKYSVGHFKPSWRFYQSLINSKQIKTVIKNPE